MTLGWVPETRTWDGYGAANLNAFCHLPATSGVACWHLTDLGSSLTDLINGIALTNAGGVTLECNAAFGPVNALHFNGSNVSSICRLSASSTTLRIAGDLTLELIMRIHEAQPGSLITDGYAYIVSWMNSGNTQADNILYRFVTSSNAIASSPLTATVTSCRWQSEHGTGTLDGYFFSNSIPLGDIFYIAITRISDVIRIYLNGRLMGTSTTLTTPDGGTSGSARFCIGGDLDNGVNNVHATLFCVRVHNTGRTIGQIQADYTATLGQVWPIAF